MKITVLCVTILYSASHGNTRNCYNWAPERCSYGFFGKVRFKSRYDKLTNGMIDRLAKEVDMLERHLQVLKMVIESEPIGIVKMSNETGYPHHKVRYSLRVLEEENLIEPSSQGAITTDDTGSFVEDLDGEIGEIMDKLEAMKIESVPDGGE